MDPYKILGVSAANIKHDSDLIPARKRAKTLFKRYSAEKKKFDAKKVLEAFEMIKRNLKGKVGEGQYKLLGRSRKERELDKHFNHQTKEIKNDKNVKRALKEARHGEKRMRLRGEKERVARPRRRAHKRNQRKKQKTKKHVDSLQGLQKLACFLESAKKFPKAIPLLNRWVREYMNQDNRGHVFEVLHKLAKADYITEDRDSRQEVIQVFEYVNGYFSAWFEEEEGHQMLSRAWRVACVLACHCKTDDAFILSRTITSLNEMLSLLESNREKLTEEPKLEGMDDLPPMGMPTPVGSPSFSDGEGENVDGNKKPEGSPPAGSPSLSDDGEGMMEFYATPTPSDEEGDDAGDKLEAKLEVKEEVKIEMKVEVKEEIVQEEVKEEKKEIKKMPPKRAAVEISLDSDDDKQENVIDSEDSVHDIDSAEEGSDAVYESLSSGSDSEVEYVDASFKAPDIVTSLRMISEHFVYRCLATLFEQRGHMWAQSKIDNFFQDVFYRRSIFTPGQVTQVEAWQARIKVLQKGGPREVGDANSNPLESHRPVVDSRETRTSIDCANSAWSAKQTFDVRDKCGGSRVIR